MSAMDRIPYSRFDVGNLTLRDELAVDRTLLANERTLLAYLRSGVALLIAGISILHFSQAGWFWGIGLTCLPAGLVTGIIGICRFRRTNRAVSATRRTTGTFPPQDRGRIGAEPVSRGGGGHEQ
jgi:putative membrane protein